MSEMFSVGDKVVWANEPPETIFVIESIDAAGLVIIDDEGRKLPSVHLRRVTPAVQAHHDALGVVARARSAWKQTASYPAETCREAFEVYVDAQRGVNECAIQVAYDARGETPPESWPQITYTDDPDEDGESQGMWSVAFNDGSLWVTEEPCEDAAAAWRMCQTTPDNGEWDTWR